MAASKKIRIIVIIILCLRSLLCAGSFEFISQPGSSETSLARIKRDLLNIISTEKINPQQKVIQKIRSIVNGVNISALAKKNLEDVLHDPHAGNIRYSLLKLLETDFIEVLECFNQFDKHQKSKRNIILGSLVHIVSCLAHIPNARVKSLATRHDINGVDFIFEVNNPVAFTQKSAFSEQYLESGEYLGIALMSNNTDWNDIVQTVMQDDIDGHISSLKEKAARKGILLAIGGNVVTHYPQESLNVPIQVEDDNPVLMREDLKVYVYLVPEVIYEHGPKERLSEDDELFIEMLMKKIQSADQGNVKRCRIVLEKSMLIFKSKELIIRKINEYLDESHDRELIYAHANTLVDAILLLQDDLSAVKEKTSLVIDERSIGPAFIHPYFPGIAFNRLLGKNDSEFSFEINQNAWGKFEILITNDRADIYIVPVEHDSVIEREYFRINLNVGTSQGIEYVYGDASIFIETVLPASSIGTHARVNGQRLVGIIKEAVMFRQEVICHPQSHYYWLDKIFNNGIHLVSYDALERRNNKKNLIGFLRMDTRIPDFYTVDPQGDLESIAEFGLHHINKLGNKIAEGYYRLITQVKNKKEALSVSSKGLLLKVTFFAKSKRYASFAETAEALVKKFIDHALKISRAKEYTLLFPKTITVEDSYVGKSITFSIADDNSIVPGSGIERLNIFSAITLQEVISKSEAIINRRIGASRKLPASLPTKVPSEIPVAVSY